MSKPEDQWYVFSFSLPKNPSRVRVGIWRKLKKAGALNLGLGSWVLPISEKSLAIFTELIEDVENADGTAFLIEANYLNEGADEEIIARFNAERQSEYSEFIEKCVLIEHELREETALEEYTFTEMEDNETMANRMITWLGQIEARDFFAEPLGNEARADWAKCIKSIQEFEDEIFRRNNDLLSRESPDKSQ